MTMVEERTTELPESNSQPAQGKESSDLYTELRDMRRADGVFDGIQKVSVKNEIGLELPPSAELAISPHSQSLDEVRADIESSVPEIPEQPMSAAERAVLHAEAAPMVESESGQALRDKVELATHDVKSTAELKYVALREFRSKSSSQGGILESDDGWLAALPGDKESQIVLETLNRKRSELDRRNAANKAQDKISELYDGAKKWRTDSNIAKEQRNEIAEAEARDNAEQVREQVRLESQDASFLRSVEDAAAQYSRDKLALKPLAEEIKLQQNAATAPLFEQIITMRREHAEFRGRAERRGISDIKLKEFDDRFYESVADIRKEINTRSKAIAETVTVEKSKVENVSFEQIKALMAFERSEDLKSHIFVPDKDITSEMAADIAGANSAELGKVEPPFEINEYTIGDTIMQRLVYLTRNKNVVIVEDWDKSSGKLKRQSVLKGNDLLIPDYQNDKLGRLATARLKRSGKSRDVLANNVYAKLGPIMPNDVKGDSDTSYVDGYSSYTNNLVRSRGANVSGARELASHNYKPNQSKKFKGFIATLTENMTKKSTMK